MECGNRKVQEVNEVNVVNEVQEVNGVIGKRWAFIVGIEDVAHWVAPHFRAG
ncbi:MAG: hypothetical protein IKZ52_02595 [Bacteroidales bacterium]|nr:hypothetical protein [Bacteroidales bacterium]